MEKFVVVEEKVYVTVDDREKSEYFAKIGNMIEIDDDNEVWWTHNKGRTLTLLTVGYVKGLENDGILRSVLQV